MNIALIIFGIIAVVGGIIAISMHLDKKRTEAMRSVADTLNFTFAEKPDEAYENGSRTFTSSRRATRRRFGTCSPDAPARWTSECSTIATPLAEERILIPGGKP